MLTEAKIALALLVVFVGAQNSHRLSTNNDETNNLPPDYEFGKRHNDYGAAQQNRAPTEGDIRLTGGQNAAEGNVEYFHLGEWGSVCDDEWDIREGVVACRMLGYRRVVQVTHSSFFGKGRAQIWLDNLFCKGSETNIAKCLHDGWGLHNCRASEAAGVICKSEYRNSTEILQTRRPSTKVQIKYATSHPVQVRLSGGRSNWEGRVEVELKPGFWGLVCGDGWGMLEADTVCKQLGLGHALQSLQTSYYGGHHSNMVLSGTTCNSKHKHIGECLHGQMGQVYCPGESENIAGVVCGRYLPDLQPDEKELETSFILDDQPMMNLQCAMEENCVASTAYTIRRTDPNYMFEKRKLLRFTARIENIGTAAFVPVAPKTTWQWHVCHEHYHSVEVFAHFDLTDVRGQKIAEGHKASFCLEDNVCQQGVKKKYVCKDFGDQGISAGCADVYANDIDCQWIDVTDLNPGFYYFKISVNPEYKVGELTYNNNAASCNLFYSGQDVRVWNCTLTSP
ncbi:Lysyl oxidase 3 [Nymphon striatum]|nr:Lysyl oxidase 3 [Nymphon striatum]